MYWHEYHDILCILPADITVTEMKQSGLSALTLTSGNRPGLLHEISMVMLAHGANILMTQQSVTGEGTDTCRSHIYFEFEGVNEPEELAKELRSISDVYEAVTNLPHSQVWGKRIIIVGGGAQVAQVAMGAVNEADRHNIRGERISVDTIPLVGEKNLAEAVDGVRRLSRASVLVVAGALMGGEISKAVERVKKDGIPVISLKMAGSVPKVADLVVTDPIQAGVFAVMHVSSLAVFDIDRIKGKEF